MKNKNKILIKLLLIVLVLIFTALIGVTGAAEYAILNSTYTGSLFNISGWGDYKDDYLSPAIEIVGELPGAYEYELINDLYIENGSLNLTGYKVLILPNVVSLSTDECNKICEFVHAGGIIFVTGSTSRYDPGAGGWRNGFGLDCMGVSYEGYYEGYVWNLNITNLSSPVTEGVFVKSETYDDITLNGGSNLMKINNTGAKTIAVWAVTNTSQNASGSDGIVQGITTYDYGNGTVIYCTGNFFNGWGITSYSPEYTWSSKDSNPSQNAENILFNIFNNYAPANISNPDLGYFWLIHQTRNQTGLVESYEDFNPSSHPAYTYDQALSVMVFTLMGDYGRASTILNGLSAIRNSDGSFNKSVSALDLEPYDTAKYTGENAWVVIAINYYTLTTGDYTYMDMAEKCANWFLQFQNTDGGIKGGLNASGGDLPWTSTEHNIDAYSALSALGEITGNETYINASDKVKSWLETKAWNESEGRFWRGEDDNYSVTDVNTWGILALGENYAESMDWCINHTYGNETYLNFFVEGFDFNYDTNSDYDGNENFNGTCSHGGDGVDTLWAEGTYGAALAFYFTGNKDDYARFHNSITLTQMKNGGIPYSTSNGSVSEYIPDGVLYPIDGYDDTGRSLTYPSVAGTAWYIFSERKFNPFMTVPKNENELFLDTLEFKTFLFFYENTDERGLTIESTAWPIGSIASSGFYLTSIPIAIERGWISYEDGYKRVNATLNSYYNDPDDPDDFYVESEQGFFAHWFHRDSGKWNGIDCFSSIDTAILMAGVLTVRQYFSGTEIENISTKLYENVNWTWMLNGSDTLSMGWKPDTGFLSPRWRGYNEGMLAVLLALGSSTHPIPNESWDAWTGTYLYKNYTYGNHTYSFVESSSTSLFTYQYPLIWFDVKGKSDENSINYFENSINATLENRAYCIENPDNRTGYGENVWGLTASECPFYGYEAHGPRQYNDGTISPTGAGGSIIFTPHESISALRYMNETYGNNLWGVCGFRDAFNPGIDWYSPTYIGIDQGAILTMIENYRSGLVQSLFMQNEPVKNAMQNAGFGDDIDTTPPAITHVKRENNTVIAMVTDNADISSVFLHFNNSGVNMTPEGEHYSANISDGINEYYIEANDTFGNIAKTRVFNLSEIPELPSENEEIGLPPDAPKGSLLVDRFDDCLGKSITGVWYFGNSTSEDCTLTFDYSENHGVVENSRSLRITYNTTKNGAYPVAWIDMGNLNLRHYKELVFWAKKEKENATFKIELKSPGGLVNYVVKDVNGSWKRIAVSLNDFEAPSWSLGIDWSNVTEFTVVFDHELFADEGVIYIDDIYFTPLEGNETCICGSCTDCTNALNSSECDKLELTTNLTNQPGTCLNNPENFNNKIFDCRGNVIEGDASGYGYGIYLNNKTNDTIRNCIIKKFEYGVYLENSSNNKITNNTANNNTMEGIILYESSGNTLINNTANNNTGSGVILFCSSNNTLINNTAINNHVHGFYGLYGESICIKASSVQVPGEDWCKAENAIDGDIATRWSSSQFSDPQFITVNLYSPQPINKVVLNWETAYAKEYKISVSVDGVNWKEVYYTNKGDGGTDEIFFNTVNASYIMMNGTQRGESPSGGKWGYSLWELETSYSDEVLSIVGANASSVESDTLKPENVFDGDIKTRWSSNFTNSEWIYADLGDVKTFNVVELNWETAYGKSYQIQISNDTENWTTVYGTQCSDGGIDLLYLGNQSARYVMMKGIKRGTGWGYSLYEITIRNINEEPNITAPIFIEKGYCPMWLLNEQTFWTTIGVADDEKEFILSEDGTIEPHKRNFTITPFLYINNTLITREDVIINQSLEKGYLPIPTVEWDYNNIVLNLTMFAYGNVSESIAYAWYKIKNNVDYNVSGKLFLAVRPFQIYPPWQEGGGFAPIRGINYSDSIVKINGEHKIFPLVEPDDFGAKNGNFGEPYSLEEEIVSFIKEGNIPSGSSVEDYWGDASAVIVYNFNLSPGESGDFFVAVPLHDKEPNLNVNMNTSDIKKNFEAMLNYTSLFWEEKVNRIEINIPEKDIANTLKANIAYTFITKDGPALQPGSVNYDKPFIRDGGVAAVSLLRMGFTDEVKEFIDWYAGYQFEDGRIPCVIDNKIPTSLDEARSLNESDSQGQYLYAILNYYYFTNDTQYLQNKLSNITRALEFMVDLRNKRLTPEYCNSSEYKKRFCGIIPNSSYGNHYYWDDFWSLKGWNAGKTITQILEVNNSYLFNWNDVPGNENDSLIDFLNNTLRVNWIENVTINKTDDNKTINVAKGNNSVIIKLTTEKVIIEIDNGRNYTCFSKDENDNIFINLTQWADEEYAALKNSVYASINLTINSENISYIPESPENANFQTASTAGAIMYCGEMKNLPQPELKNTFDRYYKELENRTEPNASYRFTPYEVRIAEAFLYMNQKERALKLLRFILDNRKPIGWNQFPEVINSPDRAPTIFGDMPHTWVGAEYINAVRSLFVYEMDDKLIIGHGIDEDWLEREEGISIKNFPTGYGKIDYTVKKYSNSLEINVSGNACPPGGFVLKSPFTDKIIIGVEINGERWSNFSNDEVVFDCSKMPALINITNCDLNEPTCCTVNENCSNNQTCNTLNHSCLNLNCSEGFYPENHTCTANITYCPIHTNCSFNQSCDNSTHSCLNLNCSEGFYPENHTCTANITYCPVHTNCSFNQSCDNSTHSCLNLNCSEGSYIENHACMVNETYCPVHTNCSFNQECNTITHSCQELNCLEGYYPENHVCIQKPDFTIINLTYLLQTPVEGDNVNITVTVRNSGNINLNLDEVNVSINISSNDFNDWKLVNLTNKTEVNVTFNWTVISGEHNISVVVDPNNLINESNEGNNNKRVMVNVACGCSTCADCEAKLNNASCSIVTLIANITNCTGTCINNPANFNNKIFDCQGHAINGNGIYDGLSNLDAGIYLSGKSENIIRNCIITDFRYGIYLYYSSDNNNITNNSVSYINYFGIYLSSSSNNTILNNNITSPTGEGIVLSHSSDNTLIDNTASSNGWGISLEYSSNNILVNNTAELNELGIRLYRSSNDTLKDNKMNNNEFNFNVDGHEIIHYYHDIEISNTVNGKKIYYWTNEKNAPDNCTNAEISDLDNVGFVALISCNNITVKNLNLNNNSHGILLLNTTNSNLLNNTANSNYFHGIYLWHSSDNTIIDNTANSNMAKIYSLDSSGIYSLHSLNNILSNNTANSNKDYGIYLSYSSNNTINNNIANSNNYGIIYSSSSNNTLINNTALSNEYIGIFLGGSNNNVINNTVGSSKWGISLSSSNNTLRDNTVNSNNYGIYLSSSLNNTMINNTVNLNNYGIYIICNSNFNTISNNTISNNNNTGIVITNCDSWGCCTGNINNTLQENEISNSTLGIYSQSSTSTINSNIVCGNTDSDFSSSDWLSSSGGNNICSKPDLWNDTGTIGCTLTCQQYLCDLNHDGIYLQNWNDLMSDYRCFLGVNVNCNSINPQDWNSMKREYDCFAGNY